MKTQKLFWASLWIISLVLALLALANAMAPARAAGAVFYVVPGGTGTACTQLDPCGSVQQAVDLAAGDEVWIASGVYTENLTLMRSVTLRGGWDAAFTAQTFVTGATLLRDAGLVDHNVRVGVKNTPLAEAVTLEGLTLRGGNDGIHVWSSDDSGYVTATHVWIEAITGQGVELDGGSLVLSATQIVSAQRGIEVDSGTLLLADSSVAHTSEEGLLLEAGGTVTVSRSTFTDAGQQGVQVNHGRAWFLDSVFSRALSETLRINGGEVLLRGNVVRDGLTDGYPGIYVEPDEGATATVRIQSNEVFAIPDHGIYVRGASGDITGNRVHAVSGNGIYVREGAAQVAGNTVTGVDGRGIYVRDEDTPELEVALVAQNTVSTTGDVGIEVRGAAATILSNTVTASADRGISAGPGEAEIAFNTVDTTSDDGIRTTDEVTRAWVHHNAVYAAANDGIDAGGLWVTLDHNTVTGSGDNGIKATHTDTQTSLDISANRVFGNATLGIAVRQAVMFTLANNIVADNVLGGLEISGDGSGTLLHNTFVGSGTGRQGAGIALPDAPQVALVNTLVLSHAVGISGTLGQVSLDHTLLWANASDAVSSTFVITPPIAALFVDPARQDYHLLPDAPVVDRGVATSLTEDVDGDARSLGAAPDIGADEVQVPSLIYLPLVSRIFLEPPPEPPVYYLSIAQSDLDYLAANSQLNNTVPGRFVADGRTWEVQVRFRGDTARDMPKRSWKIYFPGSDPFGEFWELNLNADYVDQTLLRSAVGYDLLDRAGVPTPKASYARLYLNGRYYGLFSQVEQLDELFLDRQGFDVHGNLYKPFYGNLNVLTASAYEDEEWWDYHYPKKINRESGRGDLWALMELVAATPDEDFAEAIAPLLDVNGWLDWYAVNILLGNFEMLEKNYYLYHDFSTGKWYVLPWDVDLAMGHNAMFAVPDPLFDYDVTWDNPIDSGTQNSKKIDGKWNALIDKMMRVPEFRYAHGRRLIELIHDEFDSGVMAARIDAIYASAEFYGAADTHRWRYGDFPFSAGPDELKWYVNHRREWLLANLPYFMPDLSPPLALNEWMPLNSATLSDEAGDFDPWVELYNASSAVAWNLGGMFLSDDAALPRKWRIPAGTALAPQETLVVWLDGESHEGALHANFALAPTSTLLLSDRDLFGNATIARITCTATLSDVASGLLPDGSGAPQTLSAPTPGWRNVGHALVVGDVQHSPAYPAAGEPVTITARITAGNALTATLRYRSTPPLGEPPAYTALPLAGASLTHTAQYSAVIPAQPAGYHVEYYIDVVDAAGLHSVARPPWPDWDYDWAGSFHYVAGWQPPGIVINEIMARNRATIEDESGATPDWIELHNPGSEAVDVGGMFLSDDAGLPTRSELPAGTVIPAGGYLLLWADGQSNGAHLTFSLSGVGETVALFDRLDRGAACVDAAFFPPQGFDEAWGRFPDAGGAWATLDVPTPGAPNRRQPPRFVTVTRSAQWPAAGEPVTVTASVTAGTSIVSLTLWLDTGSGFAPVAMPATSPSAAVIPGLPQDVQVRYYLEAVDALGQHTWFPAGAPGVVEGYVTGYAPPPLFINEFLASNATVNGDEAGEYDDWVELYNAGGTAVSLDGLYLSDDLSQPQKWAFPAGISIPAGGHLLIWCDGQPEQGALHAPFKLDREGEALGVFDSDAHGNVAIDALSYGLQTEDISYGRSPDGGSAWVFFDNPTPGGSNE